MTDQNPPTGAASGAEPTVPLVPSQGYSQPDVPPLEPTSLDPFGTSSSGASYPDFSYDGPALSEPTRIDPNPFPAASNYAQPTVPTPASYAEPPRPTQSAYNEPALPQDPYLAPSAQPQYQQYPVVPAQTPLHDPVAYDYGYGYGAMNAPVSDHPNAIPSLILGIVGLVFFPILCPIGWVLAARGRREVAENPGRWANGGTLTAGWIISIIGTALWGLFVLFFVGIFVLAIIGVSMS
jgi:hypothetical protein